MTKGRKQVQITSYREVFSFCTCDWCGTDMEEHYGERGYDTRDMEISFTKGASYEGGYTGNKEGWRINDLCDPCVTKLKDLLVENGIKLEEIDDVW